MAKSRQSRTHRSSKGRHRKQRRDPQAYRNWLGAGAVTLGLGAAMATGQGVALADDTSDGAASSDNTSSAATSDTASTNTTTDTSSTAEPSDSDPTASPSDTSPTSTVSAQTTTITNDEEDGDSSDPGSDVTVDEELDTEESTTPEPSDDEAPADVEPVAPSPPDKTEPVADSDTSVELSPAPSVNAPGTIASTPTRTTTVDDPPPQARMSATTDVADETAVTPTAFALTANIESDPTPTAFAAVDAPLPSSLTAPVTWQSIVSDVLRWFGLPTLFAGWIPATPVPPPLEALWLVVRRVEYTVANDAPVATSQTIDPQDPETGVITGNIDAEDPDGDTLTYTVSQQPAHGTVTVDQQGNWAYTPDEFASQNGATVHFTIAVDDRPGNPPHAGGGLITKTVELVVAPASREPVIDESTTVGGIDRPLQYSPDGHRAFLITRTFDTTGAPTAIHVVIIDTATGHSLADPVTIAGGTADDTITFSPDGTRAYLSTTETDSSGAIAATHLAIINTSTGTLAGPTPITAAGRQLGALQFNDDATRAYLTTRYNDTTTLTVLNTATGTIIGTPITAQGEPTPGSGTFNTDGTRLYLTTISTGGFGGGSGGPTTTHITVIDTTTGTRLGQTIDLPGSQRGPLTLTDDHTHAWIITRNNDTTTLTVIRTGDAAVLESTTLQGGDRPLQYSPNGHRAFLITRTFDTTGAPTAIHVVIIDTATGHSLADPVTIAGGTADDTITFSPDGTRAYLSTTETDSSGAIAATHLAIINTSTGTLAGPTPITAAGRQLGALQFNDDATRAYLTTRYNDTTTLTVLNTATGTIIGTPITAQGEPTPGSGTFNTDGTRLYLTTISTGGFGGGSGGPTTTHITVIDTTTGTRLGQTIDLPGSQRGPLTLTDDHTHAWIITRNNDTTTLTVIRTGDAAVLESTTLQGGDRPLQYSPNGHRAFLITRTFDTTGAPTAIHVVIIDTATGHSLADPVTIAGGTADDTITFSPDGTRAYLSTTETDSSGAIAATHLAIINTSTGTLAGPTPITAAGRQLGALQFNDDATRAYLTTRYNDTTTLTVLNTATGTIIGTPITAQGEPTPGSGTFNTDGTRLYLTTISTGGFGGGSGGPTTTHITVIDTTTGTRLGQTIDLPGSQRGPLTLTDDHTHAWIITRNNDTTTLTVIRTGDRRLISVTL